MESGAADNRRNIYLGTLVASLLLHGGIAWAVGYLPEPLRNELPYTLQMALVMPEPELPPAAAAAPGPKRLHKEVAAPDLMAVEPEPTPEPVVEPAVAAEVVTPQVTQPTAVASPSVTAPGSGIALAVAPSLGAPGRAPRNTMPGGTGDGSGVSTAAYKASLAQLFRSAMRYPEAARRRHISGVVLIEIELDAEGRVISRRVLESPHTLLAEAAVDTLSRLGRLPKPPEHLGAPARVVVPLSFELQS